jgi:predicted ATPase
LPETTEHTQRELTLQVLLGGPLIAAKGWGTPDVEKVYTRACILCRQVGETPQLFPVLWGLFVTYIILGKLQTARELAEQFLTLAQKVQDPVLLLWAHYAQGAISTWLGEFVPARAHLQQRNTLYDAQHHHTHTLLYGQDPGAASLAFEAWTLWFLGYPDQARKKSLAALTLARELGHPFSLAYVLDFAALLHWFRGEHQTAQDLAAAAIALCTEQGIPFWLVWGTLIQHGAHFELGQREEEIAQMRQGLIAYQEAGGKVSRSCFLALLAEMHGRAGTAEEGVPVLAEALRAAETEGERFYKAERNRSAGGVTYLVERAEEVRGKSEGAGSLQTAAVHAAVR